MFNLEKLFIFLLTLALSILFLFILSTHMYTLEIMIGIIFLSLVSLLVVRFLNVNMSALLLLVSLLYLIALAIYGFYLTAKERYLDNEYLWILLPFVGIIILMLFLLQLFEGLRSFGLRTVVEKVCLIVNYILLCSIVFLPWGLYLWSKMKLTDIILTAFIYIIFICIPSIYFSSNWAKDLNISKEIRYLLVFAYACGYILLNIIYVYIIRYMRLGNDIDLSVLINYKNIDLNILILVILLSPYLYIWIFMFIQKLMQLRWAIWDQIEARLYFLHLYWLRYDKYFYMMEKLYKISYAWISFICRHPEVHGDNGDRTKNKFRIMIHYCYLYPFILPLSLLIICLLEIILRSGHIKFGLYLVIIYLMLRPIVLTINALAMSEWHRNVSKANYIAGTWENSRYYETFWIDFPSSREFFNNLPPLDENILEECYLKSKQICYSYYADKHAALIKSKSLDLSKMSFKNRLKFGYFFWSEVRWMHSERIVNNQSIWHPMTSFFARKATDYAAVLNNHWSHYTMIERFKHNKIPYKSDIKYAHFETPDVKSISKVTEHNLITNFTGLLSRNIKLYGYNKHITLHSQNQARDDIILDFREAHYPVIDRRIHGLDQKATSNIRDPSSKIFSQISEQDYRNLLDIQGKLITNNADTSHEIKIALENLGQAANDFEKQQKIWAEVVHLFPCRLFLLYEFHIILR